MKPYAAIALFLLCGATQAPRPALPPDFVYLSDVAPSIVQDIRYATGHNFVGRAIPGYGAPECVLTSETARALANVQRDLNDAGLALHVYDCYRPRRAAEAFLAWSRDLSDQQMKMEFYPRVDKARLTHLGYIPARSEHSRGSAVDVSIDRLPEHELPAWSPGDPLRECIAPYRERFHDGSIDMGTAFGCFDELSFRDADVGPIATSHRLTLAAMMHKHGFVSIKGEWWHFRLRWERYPSTYFDFPITPKP